MGHRVTGPGAAAALIDRLTVDIYRELDLCENPISLRLLISQSDWQHSPEANLKKKQKKTALIY